MGQSLGDMLDCNRVASSRVVTYVNVTHASKVPAVEADPDRHWGRPPRVPSPNAGWNTPGSRATEGIRSTGVLDDDTRTQETSATWETHRREGSHALNRTPVRDRPGGGGRRIGS